MLKLTCDKSLQYWKQVNCWVISVIATQNIFWISKFSYENLAFTVHEYKANKILIVKVLCGYFESHLNQIIIIYAESLCTVLAYAWRNEMFVLSFLVFFARKIV